MPDMKQCAIYGAENLRLVTTLTRGFEVWKCQTCETQVSAPMPPPETLSEAYQKFNAGEFSRSNFEKLMKLSVEILKKDLDHAGVTDPSGLRFLDYGCGGGHFLSAAGQIGMTAVGLEVDAEDLTFAQDRALDVRLLGIGGPLNSLAADEQFDVIFVNHVLEHVSAPLQLVQTLSERLVPGGILIIRTPDQSSVPAKIKILLHKLGLRAWEYGFVQPPIHLYGYAEKSYRELARTLGLKVERLQRTSPLDQLDFPTTESYWASLGAQKMAYQLGKLFRSGGYMACILKKHKPRPRRALGFSGAFNRTGSSHSPDPVRQVHADRAHPRP